MARRQRSGHRVTRLGNNTTTAATLYAGPYTLERRPHVLHHWLHKHSNQTTQAVELQSYRRLHYTSTVHRDVARETARIVRVLLPRRPMPRVLRYVMTARRVTAGRVIGGAAAAHTPPARQSRPEPSRLQNGSGGPGATFRADTVYLLISATCSLDWNASLGCNRFVFGMANLGHSLPGVHGTLLLGVSIVLRHSCSVGMAPKPQKE